jgi:hypothetical protein
MELIIKLGLLPQSSPNILLLPCSSALTYSRAVTAPFLSLCTEPVLRHAPLTELSSKMWISYL